ncbi:MAG: hypothetical protein NBKEAIPA_03296 [Nitrospirae bacterium]|nr:hypothetical protein [Nitrospirota bacterium]MCE7966543.1 hypothetical protein [Nitrospira sp. NTP2]MCK6492251.1 hypothetical protein [Nitrospira sp.]MEB2339094.1 hypothetical protein [Nitrospirales bacterium]QOJ35966.1 MAG: hypothetical protein HRU82_13870 [Nitrospira sp.]
MAVGISRYILAGCLSVALLQGCAGGPHIRAADGEDDDITESHCVPTTNPPTQVVGHPPVNSGYRIDRTSTTTASDTIDSVRFSPRAREIAAIIGVHDLLAEFQLLEGDMARGLDGASLRSLAVRQELSDRLLLALFEANSIAAELECEKERAEDLASQLEEVRNDIQQGRTIMAILADSISGVFAGTFLLLGSEVLSGIIDLSGSVAALGFGVAALGGDQAYEFKHGRNLMADIWHNDRTSEQFPQPVWRYLNSSIRPNGKRTRRDHIIGNWRPRLGKPGSKQEQRLTELYFGRGGIYRINELRHRSEMLGLLKTQVNLMTQDLNLLFLETLHQHPSPPEDPV